MGVLSSVLTVCFVILCFFLVIVILLQTDKSSGMGILGGSSQSAFGSSTADVITKITAFMVALFLLGALGLAAIESYNSKLGVKGLTSDTGSSAKVIEETKSKPDDKKGDSQ